MNAEQSREYGLIDKIIESKEALSKEIKTHKNK